MSVSPTLDASGSFRLAVWSSLWLMFFLISFGFGYPTLHRYNPAETTDVSDSGQYFAMVKGGPSSAEGHYRYRVLVPYLARPLYLITRGHLGSWWNGASFSMLMVNSALCAASAITLIVMVRDLGLSLATGLIAALAYLANFIVANFQLAGLVDSADCLLMMWLFRSCLERKWYLLPVIGVLGALAKETFLPLAFLFLAGWFFCSERKPWVWLAVMVVAGLGAVTLDHWVVDGHLVTPFQIAASERNIQNLADIYVLGRTIVADWMVWITFLWLLPFVICGRDRLPAQAGLATFLGVVGALALSVWNSSGRNAVRPIFDVSAPWLYLAFAIGATRMSFRISRGPATN